MRMDRNVVLVTIDSLRADHCGYTGGEALTPALDSLADDGVGFTRAVAPGPKTPESMPAILTGHHQTQAVTADDVADWEQVVRPQVGARETLAERFDRAGYTTIGFSPNGFTSSYFGFDTGFDRFEDFLGDELRPGMDVPGPVRGILKWARDEGNWKRWEGYYDDVVSAVETASEPYFLWVFLMDVHSPYLPPRSHRRGSLPALLYANFRAGAVEESSFVRRRLRRAYEDAVGYADDFLDRLLADIPGDPVVCVHADHGESFGEHGEYGHERLLYRENLEVPFVVGNVDPSVTLEKPVSLVALPSIVTAAARDSLSDRLVDLDERRPVVAKSGEGGRIAVQIGQHKLIRSADGNELYDLSEDPAELADRSQERPQLRSVLEGYADGHLRAVAEERHIRREATTLARDLRTTAGDQT